MYNPVICEAIQERRVLQITYELKIRLVSRFRSSQTFSASSDANFGIKGTLANL